MRFLGVILASISISGQKMPKKPLWNFEIFWSLTHLRSSKMIFKGVIFILHPFLVRTGPKNPFSNFWAKGRKLTEALYRVKGGLKCVLRGFTRSDIHFWPENDQKTTFYQFLEFSEYFEDQLSKSRFFSLTMFYRVMWRKKGKTRLFPTMKFCLVSGT